MCIGFRVYTCSHNLLSRLSGEISMHVRENDCNVRANDHLLAEARAFGAACG